MTTCFISVGLLPVCERGAIQHPGGVLLDSSLRWNDGRGGIMDSRLIIFILRSLWQHDSPESVIPAKAKIQWFVLSIPAQAGMTTCFISVGLLPMRERGAI